MKKWLFFWREGGVIDLRHRRHRLWIFSGVFVLVIFFFFAFQNIFTSAEVIDFNASTCLGSWQNPEKAQGKPENLTIKSSSLSEENSAIFSGSDNQIFCGQFVPEDFEARGEIKDISLTLVWEVRGFDNADQGVDLIESIEPEKTSETSTPENDIHENETLDPELIIEIEPTLPESIPPADSNESPPLEPEKTSESPPAELPPTPETEPAPPVELTPETEPTAFLFSPVKIAHAQTTSSESEDLPAERRFENDTFEDFGEVSATTSETSTLSDPSSSETNTETSIQENPEITEEYLKNLPPPIYEPTRNFIKINYSLDGQDWLEIENINPDNWQNFTTKLPITNWEDLKNLQISIEGLPTTLAEIPKVLLDGLIVEIQYDLPPLLDTSPKKEEPKNQPLTPEEIEIINLSPDQSPNAIDNKNKTFRSDETPRFDFNLDLLPIPEPPPKPEPPEGNSPDEHHDDPKAENGDVTHRHFSFRGQAFATTEEKIVHAAENLQNPIFSFSLKRNFYEILDFLGLADAQTKLSGDEAIVNLQNPVFAQIISPENKPTDLKPILLNVNNKLRISVPKPGLNFQPGKYRLELWILKNGVVYYSETDFTWGVLAVNFNKSIYTEGDEVIIGLGALDDRGFTICDAKTEIKITSPSGLITNLSTSNGRVILSDDCGPTTVTNNPDYLAIFNPSELGTHNVKIVAETKNGIREINDFFQIQVSPLFDIERFGPTRIYPRATYKMGLKIKANQDFKGNITEILPSSFNLITETVSEKIINGDTQTITWPADLKADEVIELKYFFDPPDISPELFKLGPLKLDSENNEMDFEELRSWQLASDAEGDIILLWHNTDPLPPGWTCLSCSSGDPFLNVFPRASSTYDVASSGVDVHTHDLTDPVEGSGTSISITVAGSPNKGISPSHTHGGYVNVSSTSNENIPLYWPMVFISATTDTIPNGAVGMFNVASSSDLPSDWTYYSSGENRYIRGQAESTSGNSSSSHDHGPATPVTSNSYSTGSNGNTGRSSVYGVLASDNHTHTFAGTSLIGDASNTPPYVGLILAQTTATTTLGANSNGLIAMFDHTALPADWTITSTVGSIYEGNLIFSSSTGGATGGSTTHSHSGIVSGLQNPGTLNSFTGSGADISDATHSHDLTYTVTSESNYPIYRDVILGTYTTPSGLTVTDIVLNPLAGVSSSIVLTPNATSSVLVVASSTGNPTSATSTIYRSSVSGGADCAQDERNCYQIPTCTIKDSNETIECEAEIWYFADATDASSSYPGEDWMAQITADSGSETNTTTTISGDTAVELNTLVAITLSTTTINYGTISNATSTETSNQRIGVLNVGNASSGLNLSATAFISGSNELATSSQHYASSSFFINSGEPTTQETATQLNGLLIKPATASTTGEVGAWSSATALPGSQYDGFAVVADNFIYLIGGHTSTVVYASINFDGSLGSWTETEPLPEEYDQVAAASNGDFIYVPGGDDSSAYGTTTVYYAQVSTTGSIPVWLETTPLPTSIIQHDVQIAKGYIYITGGDREDGYGGGTSTVLYAKINNDGTLGEWFENTPLPTPFYQHRGATNGEFIYVVGGYPGLSTSGASSGIQYAWISSTGTLSTWAPTSELLEKRVKHIVNIHNGYMYVFGGDPAVGIGTVSTTFATVNEDGTLGTFSETTPTPGTLTFTNGTGYHGFLYSLGGFKGGALTTDVDYAPITNGQSFWNTHWGIETIGAPTGTYNGTTTFGGIFAD